MLPTLDLRCEDVTHAGSGTDHGQIVQTELLKPEKNGQFPDESVRMKGSPIHDVNDQTN